MTSNHYTYLIYRYCPLSLDFFRVIFRQVPARDEAIPAGQDDRVEVEVHGGHWLRVSAGQHSQAHTVLEVPASHVVFHVRSGEQQQTRDVRVERQGSEIGREL